MNNLDLIAALYDYYSRHPWPRPSRTDDARIVPCAHGNFANQGVIMANSIENNQHLINAELQPLYILEMNSTQTLILTAPLLEERRPECAIKSGVLYILRYDQQGWLMSENVYPDVLNLATAANYNQDTYDAWRPVSLGFGTIYPPMDIDYQRTSRDGVTLIYQVTLQGRTFKVRWQPETGVLTLPSEVRSDEVYWHM